jgi:hypothetical protein
VVPDLGAPTMIGIGGRVSFTTQSSRTWRASPQRGSRQAGAPEGRN